MDLILHLNQQFPAGSAPHCYKVALPTGPSKRLSILEIKAFQISAGLVAMNSKCSDGCGYKEQLAVTRLSWTEINSRQLNGNVRKRE